LVAPERPRAAIIATALTAGGISAANFEFVIAQGAYSMYAAMALCLFSLASAKPLASNQKRLIAMSVLAAAAAALVCVSNSTRGVITIVAPLVAGWAAYALITPGAPIQGRLRRLHNPVIYAIIFGAIIGTMAYKYWLLPNTFNYEAAARIGLASRSEMWSHLVALPGAWLDYFQIIGSWEQLSLVTRILQSVMWLISIGLILAPLWIVFTPTRHPRGLIILSWIVLACYGVSFSAMIMSPVLFSSMLDIRYATFPLYGSVCIIAISMDGYTMRSPHIGKTALFMMALIPVSSAMICHSRSQSDAGDSQGSSYVQRMALITSLEANDVGTILGTYWNSHVLTVLSDGKVDSYPVSVDTMLHPFPHHMPRRIFYGTAGTKQAVVLTGPESTPQAWQAVAYQLGAPDEKLAMGPYVAWIYNRDITKAVLDVGEEIDFPISKNLLEVRLSNTTLPPCLSNTPCEVAVDVTNLGQHVLASVGVLPLRLALHGINSEGEVVQQDAGRADFPAVVEPGSTERVMLTLPASPDSRVAAYQVCLLQEGVAWFCENTHGPAP